MHCVDINQPMQPMQKTDMVAAGNLGVSTGRGFFDWQARDVDGYKSKVADKLARILAIVAEP